MWIFRSMKDTIATFRLQWCRRLDFPSTKWPWANHWGPCTFQRCFKAYRHVVLGAERHQNRKWCCAQHKLTAAIGALNALPLLSLSQLLARSWSGENVRCRESSWGRMTIRLSMPSSDRPSVSSSTSESLTYPRASGCLYKHHRPPLRNLAFFTTLSNFQEALKQFKLQNTRPSRPSISEKPPL